MAGPAIGSRYADRYTIKRLVCEDVDGTTFAAQSASGWVRLRLTPSRFVSGASERDAFLDFSAGLPGDSPLFPRLLDTGVDDEGRGYLASELVFGTGLDQIAAAGHPQLSHARRLLTQLSGALSDAHRTGAVHGALRPDLVVFESVGGGHRPRLLDVGLTHWMLPRGLLDRGLQAGWDPLTWLAPEHLTDDVGARAPAADVWGFGLLAFFLLTGRPLWPTRKEAGGEPMPARLLRILRGPIPRASVRARGAPMLAPLPDAFDAWLASVLAHDPADRPALEVASAELGALLARARADQEASEKARVAGIAAAVTAALPPRPDLTTPRPEPGLLVLPDDDAYVVARADGDGLVELRRLPRDPTVSDQTIEELRAPFLVQAHEDRWVTRLIPGLNWGDLHEATGDTLQSVARIALPQIRLLTLAYRAGVLYAGGAAPWDRRSDKELLFVAPYVPGQQLAWRPIELPSELKSSGKGIDAIVFDGDTMIAVDNVYQPKWILTYDCSDPLSPRIRGVHDFGHEASGEQVVTAFMGSCLAVLAVEYRQTRIELYERHRMGLIQAFSEYSDATGETMWRGAAFLGARLYLAAGTRGLGVIDLRAAYGAHWRRLEDELRSGRSAGYMSPGVVTYHPAPSGGPVLFVTAHRGRLYLHTPGRGGLRSERLDVPP